MTVDVLPAAHATLRVLSNAAGRMRVQVTGFRVDAIRAIELTHTPRHWAWPQVVLVEDAKLQAHPLKHGFGTETQGEVHNLHGRSSGIASIFTVGSHVLCRAVGHLCSGTWFRVSAPRWWSE